MLSRFRFHAVFSFILLCLCVSLAQAQNSSGQDENGNEAISLFQQAQDAHEAGKFQQAVGLYDRAIKAQPEFPEAEYQRATALVSLNRFPEAEKGFRRAIELQADWSLPYIALSKLLIRLKRYDEAEGLLIRSLELEKKNVVALFELTDLYLRTKASPEKLQILLEYLKRATSGEQASASILAARGSVEVALNDKAAARESFNSALALNPKNEEALMGRAELRDSAGDYSGALADATEARRAAPSSLPAVLLLARVYAHADKVDEAEKILDSLDEASKRQPEVIALRRSLTKDCSNSTNADRAATEELLKQQPNKAALLSCLGAALRTVDPARSLELYRQAADVEPTNIRYATGYAAALVQARRFPEAVIILRRILANDPSNLTARSNLATALYELKQYGDAITEFKRLLEAKPDTVVAYFFIATAHDFLGEYPEALAAYETFLARADAQKNQLEIDKVNLRLPTLRNQIKRGEGMKKRKS